MTCATLERNPVVCQFVCNCCTYNVSDFVCRNAPHVGSSTFNHRMYTCTWKLLSKCRECSLPSVPNTWENFAAGLPYLLLESITFTLSHGLWSVVVLCSAPLRFRSFAVGNITCILVCVGRTSSPLLPNLGVVSCTSWSQDCLDSPSKGGCDRSSGTCSF